MENVVDFFNEIDSTQKLIMSLVAAIGVFWRWMAKPIKDIQSNVKEIRKDITVLQDDTGDILGDRLNQAHDYHTAKGWCPKADKQRQIDMHKRYSELGRNHLTKRYEEDLLSLPEKPPER